MAMRPDDSSLKGELPEAPTWLQRGVGGVCLLIGVGFLLLSATLLLALIGQMRAPGIAGSLMLVLLLALGLLFTYLGFRLTRQNRSLSIRPVVHYRVWQVIGIVFVVIAFVLAAGSIAKGMWQHLGASAAALLFAYMCLIASRSARKRYQGTL